MTNAKAATLSQAIIAQGFTVRVFKRSDGEWVIHVYSSAIDIDSAVVHNFAINNAVTAFIQETELV